MMSEKKYTWGSVVDWWSKYKGQHFRTIDPEYWLWLWNADKGSRTLRVFIEENIEEIKDRATLGDDSPMPYMFKYRGLALGDVPDEYLAKLYERRKKIGHWGLNQYLEANIDSILHNVEKKE